MGTGTSVNVAVLKLSTINRLAVYYQERERERDSERDTHTHTDREDGC